MLVIFQQFRIYWSPLLQRHWRVSGESGNQLWSLNEDFPWVSSEDTHWIIMRLLRPVCSVQLGQALVPQPSIPQAVTLRKISVAIFTDSAHWADSLIESRCPSVCRSVTIQNTHFRVSWRLLVDGRMANIGLWWHNCFLSFPFWWFVYVFQFFGFSEPAYCEPAYCG